MLRLCTITILLVLISLTSTPCFGETWSATGHKVIASICYRKMTDEQRDEVVRLLKKHPRFEWDFEREMPEFIQNADETTQAEWLFQQASIWPDLVRGGHPARKRNHRPQWHYINIPHFLTEDDRDELEDEIDVNLNLAPPEGTDVRRMNIVQSIKNSLRILKDEDSSDRQKAIHICWLLHCVGDIHQPLHSTALFSRELFPGGDKGGNQIKTDTLSNLHSAWDRTFGNDSFRSARNIAIELIEDSSFEDSIEHASATLEPKTWLDESNEIAIEHAYSREVMEQLKERESSGDDIDHNPILLSDNYLRNRRTVSNAQVVLSGVRVAKVLDQALGPEQENDPFDFGMANLRDENVGRESTRKRLERLESQVRELNEKLDRILEYLKDRY